MNLFLLGWSETDPVDAAEAERALLALVKQLPFFDEQLVERWQAPSGRVAVACVAHDPVRVGGVRYMHFEADRMAFFSGRPIVWTDEFEADGRIPLDPRFYLQAPEKWSEQLDGRCVAVRYDDSTGMLDLYTDPLGAYHVYEAKRGGSVWFSNNPELLRALTGARATDPLVLASLASCGWSLGGRPLWEEVRRLPRGTLHRLRHGGVRESQELLSAQSVVLLLNQGLAAEAAARTLVAAVQALADWPGRRSYIPVTGGRDSRLVFAAALNGECDFEPWIIARKTQPQSSDVTTAQLVCAAVGRRLRMEPPGRTLGLEEVARILRLTEPGMMTLDLAWGALTRPYQEWQAGEISPLPSPLIHTGLGGEFARFIYDIGNRRGPSDATRGLYNYSLKTWPRPLLSREGKHIVRSYIAEWVNDQLAAGAALESLSDLFYLDERTTNFFGASNGFDEYMLDVTAPLRMSALLPHEFGLPPGDRARELFHFYVLQILAPDFTRLPFGDSNPPWPTFGQHRPQRARRARTAARRVHRELSRRSRYGLDRGRAMTTEEEMLAEAARLALERVIAHPHHDVWRLLDRRRTVSLLRRDPRSLDIRSRWIVWRIATVFLTCVE